MSDFEKKWNWNMGKARFIEFDLGMTPDERKLAFSLYCAKTSAQEIYDELKQENEKLREELVSVTYGYHGKVIGEDDLSQSQHESRLKSAMELIDLIEQ